MVGRGVVDEDLEERRFLERRVWKRLDLPLSSRPAMSTWREIVE